MRKKMLMICCGLWMLTRVAGCIVDRDHPDHDHDHDHDHDTVIVEPDHH